MATALRARSWLRPTTRPTSLPPFLVGVPRSHVPSTTWQKRSYAKRMSPGMRAQVSASRKANRSEPATSTRQAQAMKQQYNANPTEFAMLAPGTYVPMSASTGKTLLFENPKLFWKYYYTIAKQMIVDQLTLLTISRSIRGGFFKPWPRPAFKPTRKGIVEEALRLHEQMSACMASGSQGSQKALAEICTPRLFRSLLAMIENRPPGQMYRWERLALLSTGIWPQVVSHKWVLAPMGNSMTLNFRQAVVRIKSRQRLTPIDVRGRVVGQSKEMEVTEHLVLWRNQDDKNPKPGPWLIYGTLKPTTPEALIEETSSQQRLERLQAEDALQETMKAKKK